MIKNRITLLFALTSILISCGDDDDVSLSSSTLVLIENNGSYNVSSFENSSIEKLLDLSITPSEATKNGNTIFFNGNGSTAFEKVDIASRSSIEVFEYEEGFRFTNRDGMALANNKLFIADFNENSDRILRIFDLGNNYNESSLILEDHLDLTFSVRDIFNANNKLLVAGPSAILRIYDASSLSELVTFPSSFGSQIFAFGEFYQKPSGEVITFFEGDIGIINNANSLEILRDIGNAFSATNASLIPSSFGYDESTDLVYLLRSNTQPAPVAYHLATFNLSNGEEIMISEGFDENLSFFIQGVKFDQSSRKLLVAGDEMLKVFDPQGNFEAEISLGGTFMGFL